MPSSVRPSASVIVASHSACTWMFSRLNGSSPATSGWPTVTSTEARVNDLLVNGLLGLVAVVAACDPAPRTSREANPAREAKTKGAPMSEAHSDGGVNPAAPTVVDAASPTTSPVAMEYAAEASYAPLVSMRYGKWKYNRCALDPDQLFDLEADPHELENLAC